MARSCADLFGAYGFQTMDELAAVSIDRPERSVLPEVKDRTEVDLSSPENSVEEVQQWRELESTLNERLSAVTQRIERVWGVVDGGSTISLRQKEQRPTG